MLEHLQRIIAGFEVLPKRLENIFCTYIFYLMLDSKKHEARSASRVFGIHESNYCRMLNSEKSKILSKSCLNRSARRRINSIKKADEVYLIVDATMTRRASKNVENRNKYKYGGGYVEGHKFTNFVLLVNEEVIPLASLPQYGKKYCDQVGIDYQTEIELVSYWISNLRQSKILPTRIIDNLHFLLDAGYDAKSIQNAIAEIGAIFTASVKSDRNVNGKQVKEYFLAHRRIPWKTICLKVSSGPRIKTKRFRARSAGRSYLKGFGKVNVVCSEREKSRDRTSGRRYFVTNNLRQSPRRTIEVYTKRWMIEVWHKKMKQNFGFGDCRSKKFHAVETHINLALCAYILSEAAEEGLPRPGTTLEKYVAAQQWRQASKILNLFGGKQRVKDLAAAEISKII